MTGPEDVRRFWFGDGGWSNQKMWFEAGRSIDGDVRARFLPVVEAAVRGDLDRDDAWIGTPRDRLALIIVLDQFTRHCYRDDPRFVSGDDRAIRHAKVILAGGDDVDFESQEKLFLAVTFEHAEDITLQDMGVALADKYAAIHTELEMMPGFARQHRDVVAKFGRLPDRNIILGRETTADEAAFLAETDYVWFERQDLVLPDEA